MIKPLQPPFRARELPLWWLAPPPCPVGSMSYDTESKSRNASCVPFRGRGPRSGEGVDGGKNDYDILILCLIALKGKRLTIFCASLALLQIMFAVHPRESVSHDSQVASLPYESCSLATPVQGAE